MNWIKDTNWILLLSLPACAALAFYVGKGSIPAPTVIHDVKIVEKVMWKDKLVTVTKPNGTTVVTHTVSGSSENTSQMKVGEARKSEYNLGLYYLTGNTFSGTVGARVGDLPLFIQAVGQGGADGRDFKVGLGIQIEL